MARGAAPSAPKLPKPWGGTPRLSDWVALEAVVHIMGIDPARTYRLTKFDPPNSNQHPRIVLLLHTVRQMEERHIPNDEARDIRRTSCQVPRQPRLHRGGEDVSRKKAREHGVSNWGLEGERIVITVESAENLQEILLMRLEFDTECGAVYAWASAKEAR